MQVSRNALAGTLPPSWLSFPGLVGLYASHNQLSGALPESLPSDNTTLASTGTLIL